ncbi:unnamed protein product, partial [Ceratitis capitata]
MHLNYRINDNQRQFVTGVTVVNHLGFYKRLSALLLALELHAQLLRQVFAKTIIVAIIVNVIINLISLTPH